MSSPSVSELVAYALFDVDPRVNTAQRPLHSFLVSLVLLESPDGLCDGDIYDGVLDLLPLEDPTQPPSISRDDVTDAIKLHVELELVRCDDDERFHLTDDRRKQLEVARYRLSQNRKAFHTHLVKAVESRGVVLSYDDEKRLMEEVEGHLVSILQEQSATVAAAWSTGGEGFEAGIPHLNAHEHLREIANAVEPGGAGVNKVRRVAIAIGLEEGLRQLPPNAEAYLAALYQRTVAMALLRQDPSLRRVKSHLASRRVAYLDANVVLAAMCIADREHEIAREAMELTRTLGAELRVTALTVREVSRRLGEAGLWMRQYEGRAEFLEIVDDFVVRSFHRATRQIPNLTWGAFIGSLEPPEAWLNEREVIVDYEVDDVEGDGRLGEVKEALARRRPLASYEVLYTDAANVVHVVRQRESLPPDEMGNRVWLVTLDRRLARRESPKGAEFLPAKVSRLASDWIELLSPCLPPDEKRLSGYVTHMVQSQFSLVAEDPTLVDKGFLLTLEKSRFDISDVLQASTERARQVLVRLQQDQELDELVEQAQPDDKEWNERLEQVVRRALREVESSPEYRAELEEERRARLQAEERAAKERSERLDAMRALGQQRRVMQRLREDDERHRAERDRLDAELQAIATLPWWRRLLGFGKSRHDRDGEDGR